MTLDTAHKPENVAKAVVYKRPPIIERVITAYAKMDQEDFNAKSDGWKSKAMHGFPFFVPRVEWDINVEEKDGVPVLSEGGPTMRIHHWFFEHAQKENRGFAQQSQREKSGIVKFSINLLKDGDKSFRFRDVEAKFKDWLPKWAEHFGIKSFSGAALDYVNALNQQTVPEFHRGGKLHIGEIFTIFSNIPGPHKTLVPPYDCQVNMLLDEEMPATGRIKVRNARKTDGLIVEMQMRSTSQEPKEAPVDQVLKEVLALHRWMNLYFDAVFTDKAKKSFEPIA